MEAKTIILGIIVIVILYIVYLYYFSTGQVYLAGLTSAKNNPTTIQASSLPGGNSVDFAYSTWVYISNWTTGSKKPLLVRGKSNAPGDFYMSAVLGETLNNLDVFLKVSSGGQALGGGYTQCSLENVPIQAWTNIIITLNNSAVDLYMNGKLVRTCLLPTPFAAGSGLAGSPLHITPGSGFEGYTSNTQYLNAAVNPRQAWNIYKEGPGGGNFFTNMLNKYRLKIAFLKDNQEVGSFDI
jgi:hypothetical protein